MLLVGSGAKMGSRGERGACWRPLALPKSTFRAPGRMSRLCHVVLDINCQLQTSPACLAERLESAIVGVETFSDLGELVLGLRSAKSEVALLFLLAART